MHASSRFLLPLAILALPAAATSPAGDAPTHEDQTLVVARTVEPRVAYRALEPKDNPVRVEATTFPGRTFHGAIDGLVGADGIQLAALDELAERVPVTAARGPGAMLLPATTPSAAVQPGMGPAASAGRGGAGGAVVRATSMIAPTVLQGVAKASGAIGP